MTQNTPCFSPEGVRGVLSFLAVVVVFLSRALLYTAGVNWYRRRLYLLQRTLTTVSVSPDMHMAHAMFFARHRRYRNRVPQHRIKFSVRPFSSFLLSSKLFEKIRIETEAARFMMAASSYADCR